ncbi:MAG TPA: SulP family inorganic anion transporter [Anaerolineales bacterium]|nr:SulP family inorganic anion transporter [Anaerolineales bacterium]
MDKTSKLPLEPEVEQPGLSRLREAVANYLEPHVAQAGKLRQDVVAGLTSAIGNVPEGMADSLLVGVNPVYGLYASLVGPLVGGLFSSTQLMMVTTTSAAALASGQALINFAGDERDNALFLMVILIGVFQIVFGLLKLGQLTRFVSYSVMTGFLAGLAMLLILSQLPTAAGYEAAGSNKLTQAIDLLLHIADINVLSLVLAALTLILAVALSRTRLGHFASIVAIAIPSLLVFFLQLDTVEIVRDISEIPRGFPTPLLPDFSEALNVASGAASIALIILVQAAGVSQSVPNPDGAPRSISRDIVAQGAANIASGFFRGLPVGGSLSGTSFALVAGARSRWALIFTGLWMAVIVLIIPGLVGYIAMPALGALLILAGFRSLKPSDISSVWSTGWGSRIAAIVTFISTLILPIQLAVGLGVLLSSLLYINQSSTDVSLVRLVKRPDGQIEELKAPKKLSSHEVTVLDIYGHLFYAGARTLEQQLPAPEGSQSPVVVLRLRGYNSLGATLLDVLSDYAEKLKAVGGRLYLSGMSEAAHEQVVDSGRIELMGPVHAYEAEPVIWESTNEAVTDARTWLVGRRHEPGDSEEDASDR